MEGGRVDVLLVEDNENDIAVAMRAFRKHRLDHHVLVLRDGAELVDYVNSHDLVGRPLKLILLDLKMPRMDGRAALRELRSRSETRNIPIVIVSSSDQPVDVRDCYALGANSYVVKQMTPWSPGTYLVDTVRYWLDMNKIAS